MCLSSTWTIAFAKYSISFFIFKFQELALRTGEIIGGLLNATFGNAVELILSIAALQKGLITVVQVQIACLNPHRFFVCPRPQIVCPLLFYLHKARIRFSPPEKSNATHSPFVFVVDQGSLLGSILSNLLLVLGMCFFFGGIKNHPEQSFNMIGAGTFSSLLLLSCIGLCVPAVFHQVLPEDQQHEVWDVCNYVACPFVPQRLYIAKGSFVFVGQLASRATGKNRVFGQGKEVAGLGGRQCCDAHSRPKTYLLLLSCLQIFPDAEIQLSRITAVVLGVMYILYLVFQLFTHADMFVSEQTSNEHEDEEPALSVGAASGMLLGDINACRCDCSVSVLGSLMLS